MSVSVISQPTPICTIEHLTRVTITREDDITHSVSAYISADKFVTFTMEDRDAIEFALVLAGYYRLLAGKLNFCKSLWLSICSIHQTQEIACLIKRTRKCVENQMLKNQCPTHRQTVARRTRTGRVRRRGQLTAVRFATHCRAIVVVVCGDRTDTRPLHGLHKCAAISAGQSADDTAALCEWWQ